MPVFSDYMQGFHGPLVGMATGLQYAGYDRVVFVPCDGPFVSSELVKSFNEHYDRFKKPVIVASDGERLQPVVVMLEKKLLTKLLAAIEAGERKPDRWYAEVGMAKACFTPTALHNFNTLEQMKESI